MDLILCVLYYRQEVLLYPLELGRVSHPSYQSALLKIDVKI